MAQTSEHESSEAVVGLRGSDIARAWPTPTIIDDTLATEALFDLDPSKIRPDATDPEGIRIGEAAAAEILRRLRQQGLTPDVTEDAAE